jgi:hypothetical protein
MNPILSILLGLVIILVGFKMYAYFNRNIDSIDNKPGNLYNIAIMVIVTGVSFVVLSIISLFLKK